MKRVYIDWGVISNLKKSEYAEVRESLLSHKGDLFFVYSSAHFEDAMRSKGDERLAQDIQTLESLVDNHLIAYNKKLLNRFMRRLQSIIVTTKTGIWMQFLTLRKSCQR